MNRYKMRAECVSDAGNAILALSQPPGSLTDIAIVHESINFGDVTITFSHKSTLAAIVTKLKRVPDGHVMVRNVNHAHEFTGDSFRDETE